MKFSIFNKSNASILITSFAVLLIFLLFTGVIFAACNGDHDCEYDIYPSGDEIMEVGYECVGGTCQVSSSESVLKDCSDKDGHYCGDEFDESGDSDSIYTVVFTATTITEGVCCEVENYSFYDECTDEYVCSGDDERREEVYECDGGSCQLVSDNHIEYCSDNNYLYCDGEEVREELYTCDGGSCVDDGDQLEEDCGDYEGWYCKNNEKSKEYRDYSCDSGGSVECDYSVDETKICEDEHDDWSFDIYGDRTFCRPPEDGPGQECESRPIGFELTWDNWKDHSYNESEHGDFYYPYCRTDLPVQVELSWDYHSQTDHDHQYSQLQVSKDSDFNNIIIGTSISSINDGTVSYTIDGVDLEFNEEYYWRVKVTDENGHESEWFEAEDSENPQTDERRATPHFTWNPPQPYLNEEVDFTSNTTPGAYSLTSIDWEFEDGDPATVSGVEETTTVFTGEDDPKTASLIVEDTDGVVCGEQEEILIQPVLPEWKEIAPFFD